MVTQIIMVKNESEEEMHFVVSSDVVLLTFAENPLIFWLITKFSSWDESTL